MATFKVFKRGPFKGFYILSVKTGGNFIPLGVLRVKIAKKRSSSGRWEGVQDVLVFEEQYRGCIRILRVKKTRP